MKAVLTCDPETKERRVWARERYPASLGLVVEVVLIGDGETISELLAAVIGPPPVVRPVGAYEHKSGWCFSHHQPLLRPRAGGGLIHGGKCPECDTRARELQREKLLKRRAELLRVEGESAPPVDQVLPAPRSGRVPSGQRARRGSTG